MVCNWPLYSLSASEGAACALQLPRCDTRATYTSGAIENDLGQNIQPDVFGLSGRQCVEGREKMGN